MSTHTLVIIMVSTIFITVILAGVITEYRNANRKHRQPPAASE